jgi:hypothetical protein
MFFYDHFHRESRKKLVWLVGKRRSEVPGCGVKVFLDKSFAFWYPCGYLLSIRAPGGATTGMAQYADGQRLRRRPNVGAVGVGHGPGSPRNWPSA